MRSFSAVLPTASNQRGGVVIFVAVAMVVLIGCAALAIDLTHLYVARNELQNAADAGALAGARFLFVNDGTYDATSAINATGFVSVETGEFIPSANKLGHDTAEANKSEKEPVEVDWVAGNGPEVERGHWSFGLGNLARGFYPNDSTAMVNLNLVSVVALDQNPNFINAVRVRARREATPIASWFARIFGHDSFQLSADAVAYVGYAGLLEPLKSDQPIGICIQSVVQEVNGEEVYDCNQGRMLNSGQDPAEHNTAGWINFSQYPCTTANAAEMRSLICNPDGANSEAVEYGEPMGAQGGVQSSTLRELIKCWIKQTDTTGDCVPDKVWNMTLPVIDCPGNNVSNCPLLIGVVNVNFAWLLGNVGKYVQKNPDPAIDTPIAPDHPDAPVPVIACETQVTVDNGDGTTTTTTELVPCTEFEPDGNKADDCSNVLPIVPDHMKFENAAGDWVEWDGSALPNALARWAAFVDSYRLHNVNDLPADFAQKTMYFFPDCKYHEPTGNTGGQWAGVLAEIPVLVE